MKFTYAYFLGVRLSLDKIKIKFLNGDSSRGHSKKRQYWNRKNCQKIYWINSRYIFDWDYKSSEGPQNNCNADDIFQIRTCDYFGDAYSNFRLIFPIFASFHFMFVVISAYDPISISNICSRVQFCMNIIIFLIHK